MWTWEGEATAARQRYRRLEDDKQVVSQEQRIERRFAAAEARVVHRDDVLNLQRVKARDSRSNSRIGQPEDLPEGD